ncbi:MULTISPECIES: glycosyl hydrolase family 18 protein [Tissierellales]|jgi:spore germination protein YaaH|uniref:GH18 domain-containing protein n=1 Tax=Acidilutibacter cellobiosedens TaxID=2507161 RepID=A0A410QEL6_9FIRM|nr:MULTISPECIES: glycosyl hydrolase family 18 protein [Tissierellales]MBE6081672.1 hypothetical protein [Tissierellaceae bacterium]QAT62473.1 hypothetical protein EQM13_13320 [Acidilutibacter cellobiosedens]SCL88944.1 putative sporulation-specific glycosylase YdhD [Sporanaerobacter sp. PP17-6a]
MKKSKNIVTLIMFLALILNFFVLSLTSAENIKQKDILKSKLVVEGNEEGERLSIVNSKGIFIPVEILKKYFDNDISIKEEENRLHIVIQKPAFTLENFTLSNRIKDGVSLNFPIQNIDGVNYINIKGIEKILGISSSYIKDSNILILDKIKDKQMIGKTVNKTKLKSPYNKFFFYIPTIRYINKGEKVFIFDEKGNDYKVRTKQGEVGFIKKDELQLGWEVYNNDLKLNTLRENYSPKGKINIVWDQITDMTPDTGDEDKIDGLDVIVPTWFSVINDKGYILNKGDYKYVENAHNKGYKVWALIDNNFDKELTSKILKSSDAKKNIINQLLIYSSIYNLDGINIDFENVYYEDKDRFTNFISELTQTLKQQNISVSIDITVPSASPTWSKFYDRQKLGKIVDYCMLMAYDETPGDSKLSGPVASINWVTKGITDTIKSGIPGEKLILGIPFYTRQWEEAKDTKGNISVKSKTLSMKAVNKIIMENDCKPVWLSNYGQNYIEYAKAGKRYRIWIEDKKSVKLKSDLVAKYNLKGISSWRKGFEEPDIWEVINYTVKGEKIASSN